MRHIVILALLMVMTVHQDCLGRSYYNSVRNRFGGLYVENAISAEGRSRAIDGDYLVDVNGTTDAAVTIDTMLVTSHNYRYQIRFANLNNKQGKRINVKDTASGSKHKVSSPQWGLVFNHTDDGHYCAVMLSCGNSTLFNDITDKRTMVVSLIQNDGTTVKEVKSVALSKGVDLEDEMNTVSVVVNGGSVQVAVGKDELETVFEADVPRPSGAVGVGYLTGAGARLAVDRAVLTVEHEQTTGALMSSWTRDALDRHFAESDDPLEGYWTYLDRDMEDSRLRLGGRYTFAIVSDGDAYDLIYMDGAEVKRSMWQTGMVKGRLNKTVFGGNYDLRWIDATMEPIEKDAYATVENGVILTLYFPVFKSQVRFAKVLNTVNY